MGHKIEKQNPSKLYNKAATHQRIVPTWKIERQYKAGMSIRKIAKDNGMSVNDIKAVVNA